MDDLKALAKRFTSLSIDVNKGLMTSIEYLAKTIALSEYLKQNKISFEEFVKLTEND